MRQCSKFMALAVVSLLCSCGQGKDTATEVHSGSRDNICHVALTSIDDALPMIHSDARFALLGDTLIINDYKSTDKLFVAYDLNQGKYLCSFGMRGQGPGEITVDAGMFFDRGNDIMYIFDLGKWEISGLHLKEAFADSTSKTFVKVKFHEQGCRAIMNPYYINDTTVLCSVFVADETGVDLSSAIGKFNLETGRTTLMDSISKSGRHTGGLEISMPSDLMIEIGSTHDRIRLYDLDGNLKKTIYGPDFQEKHDGHTYYFSSSEIAGDKLLAVYSGMHVRKQVTGHEIVVMDLEGNYIKTIDVGNRIADIAYHDRTGRVYVSQDGEPQFGYFNLEEALAEPTLTK